MNSLRILVVEDETLVARDLQSTLGRLGFHVVSICRTGDEALRAVRLHRPDVVLMDIHLGEGMDGIEAARRVQEEFVTPVIFLTAFADDDILTRARTVQPYGYLLKPFHESELRSVIELGHARHLANTRLEASEQRFVATLRSMAEGVISTDVMGIVNFVNPVAEKLTGWSAAEAVGRPLHEVFHVSLPDGGALESPVLDARPGDGNLRTILLTDKDGATWPIEDSTTPIRDASGSLAGIVILFRRRERLETDGIPLPVTNAPWPNLAGIVSSIADPLLALDADWHITYLNASAASTLGDMRESLLGRVLWDCLPPSLHRDYYHEFSTSLSKGSARSFEMDYEARGQWFEIQLYPFGSGLLVLLRDITARKQAEEQQNKLEKLESLGLLARGFAHDFNNLLTVLLGNLSLAEMSIPGGAPGRQELRTVRQATLQAQNLVQQLLTFARGGAPIKQPTDLRRLVEDWFAEWPQRPGVSSRTSIGEGEWSAAVDRHQIRRLLSNLLKNAEQAISLGREGLVTVRLVRPLADPAALVSAGLPEDADPRAWIVIEVEDNGEGIPADHLGHVFEPYFTTREDANASGLGLTVCESIAKSHGGGVHITPAPDGGTIVRVTLPAEMALSPAPAELPAAPSGEPRGTRRILVLEDEPLIRQLLIHNLEAMGCEVTTTAEGTETVSRYQQAMEAGEPFDLLIMDLSIPGGLGGAAAMERIRALDSGVCAIVSSGYSDDPVMSRYLDYGFRAVLPKPWQPRELRDLVEQLLAEARG